MRNLHLADHRVAFHDHLPGAINSPTPHQSGAAIRFHNFGGTAGVIGYLASKALISYYLWMGAKSERLNGASGQLARRRITFDCQQPLRSGMG